MTEPNGEGRNVDQEMRLRPGRPTVTRLSRKVLIGLGLVVTGGIAAAAYLALQPPSRQTGTELYNIGNRSMPDNLAQLPHDYTGLPRNVPKLGAPLPGDLGRAILETGGQAPSTSTNAGQQRLAQERRAALRSRLFVQTNYHATNEARQPAAPGAPSAVNGPSVQSSLRNPKLAFLNGPVDRRTVSPDRIEPPASPYVVQAGSVIPAALITGLRSDLPGPVTAQVTEDVYDSPTGKTLLIPQGARLIGEYDSQIAFGQSRILLVWTRLIMPDGRSIVLERQPAADAEGYAGLEDQVDNHWGMLFKAAILSTLLSIGSEAGTSNTENSLVQAIRQGGSQGFKQVGEQLVGRSLNIQPTITIRPGFPVRVMVTRDLVLEPYRS
ncbi:MAG: TrbI/VirB10 family protein [Stellaceae bacterium]